jgi:hypothetical protein
MLRPLALSLLALAAPITARAEPPPVCDTVSDGTLACIAGRQCACRFERGGAMTGRSDGFRWDCGILRPACAPDAVELGGRHLPLPFDVEVLVPRGR